MRVLCVEDEAALREDIVEYLRLQSYDVDEAGNGDEAIKRLANNHYDAVLCDVRMPQMDGYEVLDKVRREHHLRNTPFVFLTAFGGNEDKIRAHQAGCDSFLTKPIDFEVLSELLRSQVERQRMRELAASETTDSLAAHVIHAVSESLHRPLAEAIAVVEHLRDSLALGSPQALDQALHKLESRMNEHMQHLFLLVGTLQLQIESGGMALSREAMSAAELRGLPLSDRLKRSRATHSAEEATVMLDRALIHKALLHIYKTMPKARSNTDGVRVFMTPDEVLVYLSDIPAHLQSDEGFVPLDRTVNLTVLAENMAARIIPMMFALQVAHAHGGRLAMRTEGDYFAVRISLPRRA